VKWNDAKGEEGTRRLPRRREGKGEAQLNDAEGGGGFNYARWEDDTVGPKKPVKVKKRLGEDSNRAAIFSEVPPSETGGGEYEEGGKDRSIV